MVVMVMVVVMMMPHPHSGRCGFRWCGRAVEEIHRGHRPMGCTQSGSIIFFRLEAVVMMAWEG
jgi:hypothetical protein